MVYLTDHPQHAQCVLPAGAQWRVCGELSAVEQAVWRVVGCGHEVWRAETPDADLSIPSRYIVIIDDAPQSQFDAVSQAMKSGAELPDRLTCLALCGSGFRGQGNRSWAALRGNIHLTTCYRVDMRATAVDSGLVMLPAVAAARAIADVSAGTLEPRIKWVNDVLIDGQKVAGVLTSTQVESDRIVGALFGIGLNVSRRPEISQSRAVRCAAALADFDVSIGDRFGEVVAALQGRLDGGMAGLQQSGSALIYDQYRALAGFVGKQVRIWPDHDNQGDAAPIATGCVRHLLADLSLMIEGVDEPVRKGRMELLETD